MDGSKTYKSAVAIASDYLGPAAERFLRRQIEFHLNKSPDKLKKSDVPKLAEWVKVSIAILTEDHDMVDEFTKRIKKLADE